MPGKLTEGPCASVPDPPHYKVHSADDERMSSKPLVRFILYANMRDHSDNCQDQIDKLFKAPIVCRAKGTK